MRHDSGSQRAAVVRDQMSANTSTPLRRLRASAAAAHTLPLVVFTLFLMVPDWFRIENSALPWYRQGPEHWVYPVQVLVCGALLWWFRAHYTLRPWRGLWMAGVFAGVGILWWIAPSFIRVLLVDAGVKEAGWWSWLGLVERGEGFDPNLLAAWPGWQKASLVMRFVRSVIIVALVEELFWRGFLMRYVVGEMQDRPWQKVPFGTHHWVAFLVTGVGVTFIHAKEDWAGALVWGSLMYFLAVRTKSLGACVLMHALGNLLLGLYVLQSKQWGFW